MLYRTNKGSRRAVMMGRRWTVANRKVLRGILGGSAAAVELPGTSARREYYLMRLTALADDFVPQSN